MTDCPMCYEYHRTREIASCPLCNSSKAVEDHIAAAWRLGGLRAAMDLDPALIRQVYRRKSEDMQPETHFLADLEADWRKKREHDAQFVFKTSWKEK